MHKQVETAKLSPNTMLIPNMNVFKKSMNPEINSFENSVDPDQLASEEAS